MKTIRRISLKLFGNEKYQGITIALFLLVVSLIVGAIIILAIGKNPGQAYVNLLQGSGLLPKESYAGYKSMFTDLMSFINAWTPMIFAALAVAVALKAGFFNIGVSGQMLISGFITTIVIGYSGLPDAVAKPLVIIIGLLIGGLTGAFVGFLKYKFNINEVVSTIMLNYIFQYVISFFINMYYVNPVSRQSEPVSAAARLSLMDTLVGDLKMDISLGIPIAIVAVIVIYVILKRTVLGFDIKAVGFNPQAARYAGINIGKTTIMSMGMSGMLAGLAGVTYYLGYFGSIQPRTLPSMGFDAIAVSLLANNHPVGILFSSFFISVISKGSTYMNSQSGLESEMASVITGIVLLFSACSAFIRYLVQRTKDSSDNKERV